MNFGVMGYACAAVFMFVLAALLLTSWRGRLHGGLFVLAVSISLLWAILATAYQVSGNALLIGMAYQAAEVLRNVAWFAFLFRLLSPLRNKDEDKSAPLRVAEAVLYVLALSVLAGEVLASDVMMQISQLAGLDVRILGHLLLAIAGLALVEQILRNTDKQHRWAVKYLFLGIGAMFAYDFFMYADAMLFKHIDINYWQARGYIHAMIVPLLGVTAARNPTWSLDVSVSQRAVFHTGALVGAGAYLIIMSATGFYIREYGGSWGSAAQIVFVAFAMMLLAAFLLSGQIRARVRIFFSKHFFSYQYDYRDEWLSLSKTLTAKEQGDDLRERAIRALADIVDSTGGMLWTRTEAGYFTHAAHWNMQEPGIENIREDSPLCRFLAARQWIIDLHEFQATPEAYDGLEAPDWLLGIERAWLLVPLIQQDELTGFVVIADSRAPRQLNWEDRDILKTVGLQVASHVSLLDASEALMNARQFEAFNRLSSFVVHDLKNLSAQLSLIVANAEKHKHNPAFIDDVIKTVGNAADKMNRMQAQLRKGEREEGDKSIVDVNGILHEAVRLRLADMPKPQFEESEARMLLLTQRDNLVNVLAHLIHNAQEATDANGAVGVRTYQSGDDAVIEIRDDGCGMDERFIRERLFQPFSTTKGNAGMGIGAYEAREFVWSQGGDLAVDSKPGEGSKFRVRLPLYRDAPARQAAAVRPH